MLIPLTAGLAATGAIIYATGWFSVFVLLAMTAVLVPNGLRRQRRLRRLRASDPAAAHRAEDTYLTRSGKTIAAISLGFSAFVLIYTVVLVAKHA